MAWTTPATWSVSEVVTASKMNTHIRDNLNYLKGNAGAVDLADELTLTNSIARKLTLVQSGQSAKMFFGLTGGQAGLWDMNRDPTSTTFGDTATSHARIQLNTASTASFIHFSTANAANTAATERMRITGAGLVGINTSSPGGNLDVRHTSIGGFQHYSASAIGASTVTLIADGTADCATGLYFSSHVKRTGSTYLATAWTQMTTGGGNVDQAVFTDGGTNILVMRITSAGAVQLVRTAGSGTYDVSILFFWM